jgi:hypothetical protein
VRDPDESGRDEYTLPPPSDPRAAWAAKQVAPPEITVTGVLAFDDIEGRCSFLATDDGTRYEVLYPEGWTLDRRVAELRGPGDCVARAGDTVTARGTVATDRSSICQVGPIFLASAVDIRPV